MIEFERQNRLPALQDLHRFEAALGSTLPTDYRAFLTAQNGGRPIEYEVTVSGWGTTVIDSLLGVGADGRSDLILQANRMKDDLPPSVIPIGDDPGGNYFCLALTGAQAGAVLFWDHEFSTPDENEGETEFKMYLVAPTFDAFVSGLKRI